MGVRATLAFLLLIIATVKAAGGGVSFWRERFTMTCPGKGEWFKKQSISNEPATTYTILYNGTTKGLYHCKYKDDGKNDVEKKYYFYVKGSGCANCYELDATLFAVAIVVDVVGTACVMVIIYRCTKKKSSAGFTHASKATEPSHSLPGSLLCREQDGIETRHRTAPGHRFKSCTDEGRYSQKTNMTIIHAPSMLTQAFSFFGFKGSVDPFSHPRYYVGFICPHVTVVQQSWMAFSLWCSRYLQIILKNYFGTTFFRINGQQFPT